MKTKKYFNIQGPCDPSVHYSMIDEAAVAEASACLMGGGLFVHVSPEGTGKSTFLRQCYDRIGSSCTVIPLNLSKREGDPAAFMELLTMRLYEAMIFEELRHASKKLRAWIKFQKIRIGEQTAKIEDDVWFASLLKASSKPVILVMEDVDELREDKEYQRFIKDILDHAACGRYKKFTLLLTGHTQVLPSDLSEKMDDRKTAARSIMFEKLPTALKYDQEKITEMLLKADIPQADALGLWLEAMTGGHAGLIMKILHGMQIRHKSTGKEDWSKRCGVESVADILKKLWPTGL